MVCKAERGGQKRSLRAQRGRRPDPLGLIWSAFARGVIGHWVSGRLIPPVPRLKLLRPWWPGVR